MSFLAAIYVVFASLVSRVRFRFGIHFWRVASVMANANPLIGVGHNAYNVAYDFSAGQDGRGRSVHSACFGVVAKQGYARLTFFVSVFVLALTFARRPRRVALKNESLADVAKFATAVEASLMTYAAGACFVPVQYLEMFWHIVGLAIALDWMTGDPRFAGRPSTRRPPIRRAPPGWPSRLDAEDVDDRDEVVAEALTHVEEPPPAVEGGRQRLRLGAGREVRGVGVGAEEPRKKYISIRSEETIAPAGVRRVSKRWASPQSHALAVVLALILCCCQGGGSQVAHVQARPVAPAITAAPGVYALGMGTRRLRDLVNRDGMLVIPKQASRWPLPLIVLLHGGGGTAEHFRSKFRLADEYGVVMLVLDSRHNTWDGIDGPFGPDVMALDAALRFTFARVAIDPRKIALSGVSDGGAYALSLGIANGDLFTHLVAVSPGFYAPPAQPIGRPRIFLAHGTRDNVYSVAGTRGRIAPRLKDAGYDVTYFEYDGPHWVTDEAARRVLEWLVR